MIEWTGAIIGRLRDLAAGNFSASEIAHRLSVEFDLDITRNMVIGKASRNGIVLPPKDPMGRLYAATPIERTEAKRNADRSQAMRAKRARNAPPMAPASPPALRRRVPVVGLVPTGRTPVTFLASGDFVCKAFMPGQEDVEPPYKLVCGNPVQEGSRITFCQACKEGMGIQTLRTPSAGDKTLFMFPRKRQAERAA